MFKINVFSFSSPITTALQSRYLSKISNIDFPNTSYPFAVFNFPTKEIIFSFF